MPPSNLEIFQFYCSYYDVEFDQLLPWQVYIQSTLLAEDAVYALPHMERNPTPTTDLVTVEVKFSDQIFAILSGLARCLRRSLEEIASDLLLMGASEIGDAIKEGIRDEKMKQDELVRFALDAREFHWLSRRNLVPVSKDSIDSWADFHIERPDTSAI